MEIHGIEGRTHGEIASEVAQGARFVLFHYCISVLVMTFRRGSAIYYVGPGESAALKGLRFTLLSLVAGWWGIPWGPIYTVGSVFTNLTGGKDVTREVLEVLTSSAPSA